MKYIYLISLIIILTIGCEERNIEKEINRANNPNSNITLQNSETDIRAGTSNQPTENQSKSTSRANQDALSYVSATKRIHNSMPKYTFTLDVKDPNDGPFYPSHIEIINSVNGKRIQVLNAEGHFDNDGHGLSFLNADPFQFVDLNNDGYLDMRILTKMGATGNDWYATYIYIPELKKYKYHEALSRLSGVKLDPKSKQIITYWRTGWCSEFIEYFKMGKNRRLVLHKVEWTEISSLDSDKVCIRITGIPRDKELTNLGYDFYHGRDDDYEAFLQKNVKVIKKDVVHDSLDCKEPGHQ